MEMNIFRLASQIFNPPRQTKHSYGLTALEVSRLIELQDNEDFKLYQATLDKVIQIEAEKLLAANTDESLHFYRGTIQGTRKCATLVDELIQEQNEHARRESNAAARDFARAERTLLATYGTSAWNTD